MTTGIALVGASVIAVTPVTAPPPQIQTHAVQLAAAIDNPIDVFSPVFDRAGLAIRGAIQAQIDNPFPIVHGMIGKALADAQTLATIADGFGRIFMGIATGFPPALGVAFQKASAGNFTGAVDAFAPVFMGPLFQGFAQYFNFVAFVKKQFDVVEQVAGLLMGAAWGLGPGMLGPVFSVVRAVSGTLDALAVAIPAGDLGGVVNALQHGAANLAIATIGFADMYRVSIDAYRTAIGNILFPPPPEPEEPWEIAAIPDVTTLALPVSVTLATEALGQVTAGATEAAAGTESATPTDPDAASAPAETPESEVTTPEAEPTDPVTTEPVTTEPVTTEPVTTEPVTTEPVTTEPVIEPLVRDSLIAVPGTSGLNGAATNHSAAAVSAASEKISAAADKFGQDIKKVFAKPDKKAPAAANAGSTGSTGASGDAE